MRRFLASTLRGRPFWPTAILVLLICCAGGPAAGDPAAGGPAAGSASLSIVGSVQDSDGRVVAGARVELEPMKTGHEEGTLLLSGQTHPVIAAVSTDARGMFRASVDRPGIYRLRVESEGMVPTVYLPLVVIADRAVPPVVLEPSQSLPVRVTDDRERPVAGAWVFVENAEGSVWGRNSARGWMPDFRRQLTNENGEAWLDRAPGETLFLRAAHAHLGFSPLGSAVPEAETSRLILRPSPTRPARVHLLSGAAQGDVLARLGRAAWPMALSDPQGTLSLPWPQTKTRLWLMSADGRQLKHTIGPGSTADPQPLVFPSVERIRGSVVDETGEPLPGAVIWSGASPATAARTDAGGAYELIAPSGGRFWLQAEVPGRRPGLQWVDRDNPSPAFVLRPSVGIRGRVVDELGRPVDHAALEARPLEKITDHPYYPGRIEASAFAQREGSYILSGLEPGAWYEVRVSRPGFHPLSVRMGAPRRPTAATFVEVELTSSRQAFGWVVDLEERPIADAEVVLTRADHGGLPLPTRNRLPGFESHKTLPGAGERRARTDEDGRFELEAVHGRAVDLTVYAKGFGRTRIRDLLLDDESSTDLGTILMAEGASIEGRVILEDGSPAVGVAVFIDLERQAAALGDAGERAGFQPDAVTDSEGRFRASGWNPGDRLEVLALFPGYAPARQKGVTAPSSSELVLELEQAGRLTINVVDAENRPLPGAAVQVTSVKTLTGSEDRPELGIRTDRGAVADSTGRVELDVRPGRLELSAASGPWIRPEPLVIDAQAGEKVEVDLVLERGRTLFGWVIDSQGRPIDRAEVLADGLSKAAEVSAVSNEEGYFELVGLPGGSFQLTAARRGFVTARREVDPDRLPDGLELILEDGLDVSGRVVDDRGFGAHGALVELIGDGLHSPAHHAVRSAGDGTFLLPSVAPGRYQLQAFHPEFAEPEKDRWIEVGPELGELRVVLDPAFTVSGQILGLDFDQLTTVEVTAESDDRRPLLGRVDYSGRFFVEGLGSGAWLLRASLPDGQRQTQARVWLDGGIGEVSQDLEFTPALTLQGTVTSSGRPLGETRLSLSGLDADVERAVATDHLGRYRFDDLAPGRYRLGATYVPEMLVSNRRIDLRSDRHLDLELEASRVAGRVIDAFSGEGLSAASLVLRRLRTDESVQEFIISDSGRADGDFSFPRVPPGLYRLEVRREGFKSSEQTLEVVAGRDVSGLEAALDRAAGVRFRARLTSGQIPAQIYAAEVDDAGSPKVPQSARPDSNGQVHLSTFSGETTVWVGAPGAALTAFNPRVAADEPLLVLEPGSRAVVRVPDLLSKDGWASLELHDTGGQAFKSLGNGGGFKTSWSFAGGVAEVPGVPAGSWTLSVTTPDGRRLTRAVAISGPQTEIVFE